MREIVQIQIGQCGNNIGANFWESISKEHGISEAGKFEGKQDEQLERINVHYTQERKGTYQFRSVLMDLQSGALDSIRSAPYGKLFKPQNYVIGSGSASNCWAKGYYGEGANYIDTALDIIRHQLEECDQPQGFQITHSLGGGTGSGMGSLLIEKLNDEWPDKIFQSVSVFPSSKVSDNVLEYYNVTLGMSSLYDREVQCFRIDNEALHNLCTKNLKIQKPTYKNLNRLVGDAMASFTCSLRFPGQLNSDLRKMSMNLVPFPKLHYFGVSCTPLTPQKSEPYMQEGVAELAHQMFHEKSLMSAQNIKMGRFLTASVIFRGKVSMNEAENQMLKIRNKNSSYFVEWIPNNITVSACNAASKGKKLSATFIANTTAIEHPLKSIRDNFEILKARKAFLHWYMAQGLEELRLIQAEEILKDLICEYQMYANITQPEYGGQFMLEDEGWI